MTLNLFQTKNMEQPKYLFNWLLVSFTDYWILSRMYSEHSPLVSRIIRITIWLPLHSQICWYANSPTKGYYFLLRDRNMTSKNILFRSSKIESFIWVFLSKVTKYSERQIFAFNFNVKGRLAMFYYINCAFLITWGLHYQ